MPVRFYSERQRQNEMHRSTFDHVGRGSVPRGNCQQWCQLYSLLTILRDVFWNDIEQLHYLCHRHVYVQRELC